MREQLTQYVKRLLAGGPNCEDIRQEILQNTLDRYDDLIDQGKAPEAAYRLAISGIGDINEILGTDTQPSDPTPFVAYPSPQPEAAELDKQRKLRAVGIALYILSAIPLIILSDMGYDILGLSLTLIIVAAATYIMILIGKKDDAGEEKGENTTVSPKSELKESIDKLIFAIGLVIYFIISFSTGAWYITWILFPIIGCTQGLVKAVLDLKEANKYEN